ncbi:MAG: hypothetical protein ACRDIC_10670, partial [bacterium]
YNKFNTYEWYKEHVEHIPKDHDPTDKKAAWELLDDFDKRGKLPLGILFREVRRRKAHKRLPIWDEELAATDPSPMFQLFK